MKDGIYTSENAVYFVKDGKVIMRLMGDYYKTTENFMVGASYEKELSEGMKESFKETYNQLKSW